MGMPEFGLFFCWSHFRLVYTGNIINIRVDGIDGDLRASKPLATEYPNSLYINHTYLYISVHPHITYILHILCMCAGVRVKRHAVQFWDAQPNPKWLVYTVHKGD